MKELRWKKSGKSPEQTSCVEVALDGGRSLIRDSKNTGGAVLQFSERAWDQFRQRTKSLPGPVEPS